MFSDYERHYANIQETLASLLQKAYQKLPIKNAKELAIDGRVLITKAGVKPGPLMGKILQQLTLAVVNGEIANDATVLLEKVEEITKEG